MIVCEICKREFTTYKGIGQHILKHNMTSKEYYDNVPNKSSIIKDMNSYLFQ